MVLALASCRLFERVLALNLCSFQSCDKPRSLILEQQLSRPLFALQIAKWTGDFFNKGIYDIHVNLRGVPLLEWETDVEMDK